MIAHAIDTVGESCHILCPSVLSVSSVVNPSRRVYPTPSPPTAPADPADAAPAACPRGGPPATLAVSLPAYQWIPLPHAGDRLSPRGASLHFRGQFAKSLPNPCDRHGIPGRRLFDFKIMDTTTGRSENTTLVPPSNQIPRPPLETWSASPPTLPSSTNSQTDRPTRGWLAGDA